MVSTVSYTENGNKRKIMYEGGLGGMMVPYGDPDAAWLYKIFMDAGEYGVGLSTRPLNVGSDVPKNATLFDAAINDTEGKAQVIKNSFALFERYADPEWSHNGDARERRELVLRAIATIGNYDYVLDWVFLQNGSIKLMAGATGLAQVKAVDSKTMDDKTAVKRYAQWQAGRCEHRRADASAYFQLQTGFGRGRGVQLCRRDFAESHNG